jgi:disulfide bond formation protein DsbB
MGTVLERTALAAGLVAAALAATLLGAWVFEWAGYAPCPLCLQQRWPYHLGIPLAAAVALLAALRAPRAAVGWGLVALGALLAGSALFGAYHAGVEWGWWPGPTDCAGTGTTGGISAGTLLQQMQRARVVLCDEVAIRILGLSLAGWNAVISAALLALTAGALLRLPRRV